MSESIAVGARLLRRFLEANGLRQIDAAKALRVTPPTLYGWLTGMSRPRAESRDSIAVWTHGEVPAESWASADELAKLGAVQPFAPSDDSGEHRAVTAANDDEQIVTDDRDASNDDDAA